MDTNHLPAGPVALTAVDRFDGDFDFLPFAAQMRYGQVPTHTTSDEFALAVSKCTDDLNQYVEAHWHIEAVRERRLNPGRLLDEAKADINRRVAARLFTRIQEQR